MADANQDVQSEGVPRCEGKRAQRAAKQTPKHEQATQANGQRQGVRCGKGELLPRDAACLLAPARTRKRTLMKRRQVLEK